MNTWTTIKSRRISKYLKEVSSWYTDNYCESCSNIDHKELNKVIVLSGDLSRIPLEEFDRRRSPESVKYYYTAFLTMQMKVENLNLTLSLICNGIVVGTAEVKDVHKVSKTK